MPVPLRSNTSVTGCGWSRSVSKRYSRLLAQPRAPRACRIAGMSQFALTSSHKLASTLSTHGRPLPPRAMDDEPPKRTSATRPRERLRAGWNVRINALRARVHVMSIEGVAGMHGSLPGLAAGRFGVIMFFSACRLPSFAPEDPPSHASENQITTGMRRRPGATADQVRTFPHVQPRPSPLRFHRYQVLHVSVCLPAHPPRAWHPPCTRMRAPPLALSLCTTLCTHHLSLFVCLVS